MSDTIDSTFDPNGTVSFEDWVTHHANDAIPQFIKNYAASGRPFYIGKKPSAFDSYQAGAELPYNADDYNLAKLDADMGAIKNTTAYNEAMAAIYDLTSEAGSPLKDKAKAGKLQFTDVSDAVGKIFAKIDVANQVFANPEGVSTGIAESASTDADQAALDAAKTKEEIEKEAEDRAKQAQALKEAQERAAAAAANVKPTTSSILNEKHFIQANLVNIIDLKTEVVDLLEKKSIPYEDNGPNASLCIHGDPWSFMSELAGYPQNLSYFNLPTSEISSLQPYIRFFKKYIDPLTSDTVITPIRFDTSMSAGSMSVEDLLKNKRQRATGVGIKSFTVDYVGVDRFSMRKSFEAKLKIYAASLSELFRPRTADGGMYSYIDLALMASPGGARNSSESLNVSKLNEKMGALNELDFEILAVVGVSNPTKVSASSMELSDMVANNVITLTMKAAKHEFNFVSENGAVELEIHYHPWIEKRFSGSEFNILNNIPLTRHNIRTELYNHLSKLMCENTYEDAILQLDMADQEAVHRSAAASLLTEVALKDKVRFLPISPQVVSDFLRTGPLLSWDKVTKAAPFVGIVGSEDRKNKIREKLVNISQGSWQPNKAEMKEYKALLTKIRSTFKASNKMAVRFVFLSDLVDTALAMVSANTDPTVIENIMTTLEKGATSGDSANPIEALKKYDKDKITAVKNRYLKASNDFKNYRVILGPIEIADPANPSNTRIISMGDLPIPLILINEFLTNKATKRASNHFDLARFLKEFITRVIPNFLNDDTGFGGKLRQNISIDSTTIVGFDESAEGDPFSQLMMSRNTSLKKVKNPLIENQELTVSKIYTKDWALPGKRSFPMIKSSTGRDLTAINPGVTKNYLVFYAEQRCSIEKTGDRITDAQKGVHHYLVGKDRGIVKDMKLEVYRDDGGMKALRLSQTDNAGLSQLHEIYNVNITTYANLNIWPGTTIYVDPRGWIPEMDPQTLEIYGRLSAIEDLGLGGYYNVIRTSHTFGAGQLETSIFAQWFANGGTGPRLDNTTSANPNEAPVNKCAGSTQDTNPDSGGAVTTGTCNGRSPSRIRALEGSCTLRHLELTAAHLGHGASFNPGKQAP